MLASLDCRIQRVGRRTRAAFIRPIKHSEMLADNLFRGVADDSLCGAIPTFNMPFWVHSENCIINNTFNKKLEVALNTVERRVLPLDLAVQSILNGEQMRFDVLVCCNRSREN